MLKLHFEKSDAGASAEKQAWIILKEFRSKDGWPALCGGGGDPAKFEAQVRAIKLELDLLVRQAKQQFGKPSSTRSRPNPCRKANIAIDLPEVW